MIGRRREGEGERVDICAEQEKESGQKRGEGKGNRPKERRERKMQNIYNFSCNLILPRLKALQLMVTFDASLFTFGIMISIC